MKKLLFTITITAVLLISGCCRCRLHTEPEAQPAYDWQTTINRLQALLESHGSIIAALEGEAQHNRQAIYYLEELLESAMQFDTLNPPWDWTGEDIRQNLIENSYKLPWGEIFGQLEHVGALGIFCGASVFIGPGYAIAQAGFYDRPESHMSWQAPDVLLTYTIMDEYTIHWQIAGHYFTWGDGFTLLPNNWQNRRRHITDAETVTVRFYHVPYLTGPDYFAAYYSHVVIPGPQLWEETIRLMAIYNGTQIWDFWYEGRRIYVDIKPMHWPGFTMGSVSFWIHARAVLLTFATFPDVDEIQIMFGGNMVELDHHGAFFGYYRIGVGFPMSPYAYDTPIVGGWQHGSS